jgi:putative SOS response-associated peptidase YedK
LLRPAPKDVLRLWPVDKKVGNIRDDVPDLIEPIKEPEPTLL